MKRAAPTILLTVILLALAPALPGHAEELITLPTRSGVTQSFYLTQPDGPPVASLILFTGGTGKLGNYGPAQPKKGNFLVRSRDLFVARGFIVAVMDAPSDQSGGMEEFRLSDAHRRDIAFVIAYLRQAAPLPVWLIGTSRGTLSAANGATLETGGPDGLVLTSSVTRTSKHEIGSVYDAGPSYVNVPTLLVHNRDDGCVVCPFSDIPDLLSRFKNAPRKALIAFEGGDPPITQPCEALSRHGYLGIEDKVVIAIADWINQR
jgi:pimeloyl-ACP methyl ester carboxylesterase